MARPYYTYGTNLLNRETYTSTVNTTYGIRRYFSSIDTDVYFGNQIIDEMVAFDFVLEENKMPIFGYNNFSPKRMIIGRKNIQGSFAINFTQTFSLKALIDGLDESLYASEYEEPQFYCEGDNALFGKGFDITLSYGEAKDAGSYNACTQTLVGCYITSYRQAFDTSGEPILDMYTFIAKDLIITTDSTSSTSSGSTETETTNDANTQPEGTDTHIFANEYVPEEIARLEKECQGDNGPLGIRYRPEYKYNYESGEHIITMFIMPQQNVSITVDSITVGIDGQNFKLTKDKGSEYYYSYKMKGTEISKIGTKLKKQIEKDNVFQTECSVDIAITYEGAAYLSSDNNNTILGLGTSSSSGYDNFNTTTENTTSNPGLDHLPTDNNKPW